MTGLCCAIALIFSGYLLDGGLLLEVIKQTTVDNLFFHFRDIQAIGMMLLAFLVCPYKRTELKVATFFLILWRILVFGINCFDVGQGYTLCSLLSLSAVYLAWPIKSWWMGEYKHSKPQPGAYHIFFPVHSIWGLLQSVFLPWHPARYESRMISDGNMTWCVNKKEFVKYEKLNLGKLDHVKVYLGRPLNKTEIIRLNALIGANVIPGWKDCREFIL